MKTTFDPNILALLAPKLGGGINMPRFAPGSGMDPNLGALLVGAGLLPRRQDTAGNYLLPGQQQGGPSGLDNQQYAGLDRLHDMQSKVTPHYQQSNFATPGMSARVSQSPTVYNQTGGDYLGMGARTPRTLSPVNMQPTAEEMASMDAIRRSLGGSAVVPSQPRYSQTPEFQAFEKAAPGLTSFLQSDPNALRQKAEQASVFGQGMMNNIDQSRQMESQQRTQDMFGGLADMGRGLYGKAMQAGQQSAGYAQKAAEQQRLAQERSAASKARGFSIGGWLPDSITNLWPQAFRGNLTKRNTRR